MHPNNVCIVVVVAIASNITCSTPGSIPVIARCCHWRGQIGTLLVSEANKLLNDTLYTEVIASVMCMS